MKQQTKLIVLAFGLAVVLAAAQAAAQTGHGGGFVGPPVSLCATVAVSGSDNAVDMGRRSFSATRSADLIFHVQFDRSLDKEHVVTLKIFTPHGYLYRKLDVPLAPAKGKAPAGARRLPGYPYPVPVQTPHTVTVGNQRYQTVDVSFPVAGSAIVSSSLYGRWKVEVFLDGAARPCAKPTIFNLAQ